MKEKKVKLYVVHGKTTSVRLHTDHDLYREEVMFVASQSEKFVSKAQGGKTLAGVAKQATLRDV